jgi:hypothetical protein
VLDESKCNLSTLLQFVAYKTYPKNSTAKAERNPQKHFAKHKSALPADLKSKLTPHHNKPPHPYGLPRIHNKDIPLRTIVDSVGSLCYAQAFSS